MASIVLPACDEDIVDAVADALRDGSRLAITGGASKAGFGAPADVRTLPMAGLQGIVEYDPAELVLTVKSGTALADVEALIADAGQMLAFDPFDHGPIYGQAHGKATIGGVIASGISGSRRVSAGAARDHLLGFRAVSGRAEKFTAGAKVVKNVTGYDLPKLATGSWGRLFAITELTLKVMPSPREAATRMIEGLDAERAIFAMACAMGSQAEVVAAAFYPAAIRNGTSATILRIEGVGPSVTARCTILEELLNEFGKVRTPSIDEAAEFWEGLKTLSLLGSQRALWRINVRPSRAYQVLATFDLPETDYVLDWAGGLIWAASDAEPASIRKSAISAGGHAVLVRADGSTRKLVPAFHPPAPGIAALEERVRRAFDPTGLFETGRF